MWLILYRTKAIKTCYIELTQGKKALVDEADYDMLMEKKWHHKEGYAVHTFYRYPQSPTTLYMHRYIMNPPANKFTDHKDGDGLNNTRSNLRIVTHSQNMMNKKVLDNTKSGYKGVTLDPRSNLWQARITFDRKRISLGTFKSAKEAAVAYVDAAKKMHGKYMHYTLNTLSKDLTK